MTAKYTETNSVTGRCERQTCMNNVAETELMCNSETCQLDRRRVTGRRHDDKLRLQVAVDDAVVVTVAECFQQLTHVVTDTTKHAN